MDLLTRFTHRKIDAFETLVRQFQGDIYAWTVRIVRDQGVAEDLTVETLWRIYRASQQFRLDGNFGAWARRIAANLTIDHLWWLGSVGANSGRTYGIVISAPKNKPWPRKERRRSRGERTERGKAA